ncbi:MAG: hypothetical protein ACTSPN_17345 [Promethearchaeota archaeon]
MKDRIWYKLAVLEAILRGIIPSLLGEILSVILQKIRVINPTRSKWRK